MKSTILSTVKKLTYLRNVSIHSKVIVSMEKTGQLIYCLSKGHFGDALPSQSLGLILKN